jgi:tRNA dimethylallyltransferase
MAHLPEGDAQRLIRAWEIFESTGKPLSYFQNLPRQPLVENIAARIIIEPPREKLYAQCDARAEAMMGEGAVEEVRTLVARKLDPSLPVMKALGVPEITAFLSGNADRDETIAALQQSTRRFAKRQLTWFRGQASGWPRADIADLAVQEILSKI